MQLWRRGRVVGYRTMVRGQPVFFSFLRPWCNDRKITHFRRLYPTKYL